MRLCCRAPKMDQCFFKVNITVLLNSRYNSFKTLYRENRVRTKQGRETLLMIMKGLGESVINIYRSYVEKRAFSLFVSYIEAKFAKYQNIWCNFSNPLTNVYDPQVQFQDLLSRQ